MLDKGTAQDYICIFTRECVNVDEIGLAFVR